MAAFLHAESEEIVYTSGATAGLNMVAYGIGERLLQEGDIVLSSEAEHALVYCRGCVWLPNVMLA